MAGKNQIAAISNLSTLRKLDVLDLHSNEISQIQGLESLTELRVLNLAGNQISLMQNLCCLRSLTELNIRRNCLEGVSDLDSLPALQRVFLSHNFIRSFASIRSLLAAKGLIELSLDGNPISESDPSSYRFKILESMPRLRFLDLIPITAEERAAPPPCPAPQTLVPPIEDPIKTPNSSRDKMSRPRSRGKLAAFPDKVPGSIGHEMSKSPDMKMTSLLPSRGIKTMLSSEGLMQRGEERTLRGRPGVNCPLTLTNPSSSFYSTNSASSSSFTLSSSSMSPLGSTFPNACSPPNSTLLAFIAPAISFTPPGTGPSSPPHEAPGSDSTIRKRLSSEKSERGGDIVGNRMSEKWGRGAGKVEGRVEGRETKRGILVEHEGWRWPWLISEDRGGDMVRMGRAEMEERDRKERGGDMVRMGRAEMEERDSKERGGDMVRMGRAEMEERDRKERERDRERPNTSGRGRREGNSEKSAEGGGVQGREDGFEGVASWLAGVTEVSVRHMSVPYVLSEITAHAQHLPAVLSLQLVDNNISTLQQISSLVSGFDGLERFSVLNNPICLSRSSLRAFVVKTLPKLKYFNDVPLTDEERSFATHADSTRDPGSATSSGSGSKFLGSDLGVSSSQETEGQGSDREARVRGEGRDERQGGIGGAGTGMGMGGKEGRNDANASNLLLREKEKKKDGERESASDRDTRGRMEEEEVPVASISPSSPSLFVDLTRLSVSAPLTLSTTSISYSASITTSVPTAIAASDVHTRDSEEVAAHTQQQADLFRNIVESYFRKIIHETVNAHDNQKRENN